MHFQGNNFRKREDKDFLKPGEMRTNFQIRVPQVRVIKDDQQLGVMSTDQAQAMAEEIGMDLVEVVPTVSPPICKIMDYGKFRYEKKIKDKESARKQRESKVQYKEIRLRPAIAQNDMETKVNMAKKFLSEGYKVQFMLQFRGGREMSHKENGMNVMLKIVEIMGDQVSVETQPRFEGNKIVCCVIAKV